MNLRDIVLNYLTDNEKGMQQLITWFLNDVMNEKVAQLDKRGFSRAADTIHRFHHRLMHYRSAPPEFWKKICTINLLERVNRELKRRSKKIGAFPSDASLLRLAGSILIDINEE